MEALNVQAIKHVKLLPSEISLDWVYKRADIKTAFFGLVQRISPDGFYPISKSEGYYPDSCRKKLPTPYSYNEVHVFLRDRIEIYYINKGMNTLYFDNYGLAEAKFKEITSNPNFIQI